MAKEKPTKNNDTLFSVYGARLSKSGKRVNVSLVTGEDDAKKWATVSIKLNDKQARTKAQLKDGYAYIKVPLLED